MAKRDYMDPNDYSTKTLIGNWYEEKSAYQRYKQDLISTYNDVYTPKPHSTVNPSVLWKEKLLYEGLSARIVYDHEFPKYLDNLSTTYDLSYNHFPHCMEGPIKRKFRSKFLRYEPDQDYTLNYGNITKCGLQDYKNFEWRNETLDPRKTLLSVYTESYVAPKREDLVTERASLPISNSSLMDPTNIKLSQLQLRNSILLSVPPNANLVQVPRATRCNPITWECPSEETRPVQRCVPPRKPHPNLHRLKK